MNLRSSPKIKKSLLDLRDHNYRQTGIGLKRTVDLREWDSAMESQGELGSCVGNAMANAYEVMLKRFKPDDFEELSRLFVYYNARMIEDNVERDAGVLHLRNAFKALKLYGICKESIWPYREEMFDNQPSPEAYADGILRRIKNYEMLNSITDMLEVLNMDKPIVMGLDIYDPFLNLTKENCIVPMPTDERSSLGAHALIAVGYSLAEQQFLIKNSFGTEWGYNGYAWLPFEYAKKYVFEKWAFDIE